MLVLERLMFVHSPAGINLLKVNSRNTRTRFEICSKYEHISHLVLVFL